MALKYRLFLSYLFFAVCIASCTTYFNLHIEQSSKGTLHFYIIVFLLVVLISGVLATFFSKRIITLSESLKSKNITLHQEIKQKTDQLDKSLKLIDKYIIRSKTDTKGIITEASEAFCDISGYTKEELIGKPHSIVRHPDMESKTFQIMWDVIKSGKTWHGIIQNKTKSGDSYWVNAYIEPDFDIDGNIQGYMAIRHNITSEILLESQMRKNKAIINFANSAIGTIDFEGNFLTVNSGYTKLFGYTKEEFKKKNCLDMTAPQEQEKVKEILLQAQELGIVSHFEKICVDKYGNEIHVDISLNKLPDNKSFVIVVNSLEDKRKLEQINTSLAKQVEQEVEKNMLQLEVIQNEQLKHAKLNSIGLMAAGIIHEINTPLTYIKGNLEMFTFDIEELPPGPLKRDIQEDLKNIDEGIIRIENIIKSMREFSEISSEVKQVENIYETLITSLTVLHNTAKQISNIYINGKQFNSQLDREEFEYLSEVQKQRIEQVWIVIINNALDELIKMDDYENRKLEIFISSNEQNIIVKFKDNAGGIDLEILPKIFEPLISTKQSGGIGIGLNVAKKIIEDQDGEILAYNDDEGAIFEVILPLSHSGKDNFIS